MSRELATIVRDLPLEIDLDAVHAAKPDRSKLLELFTTLEFRTLARRVTELELVGPGADARDAARAGTPVTDAAGDDFSVPGGAGSGDFAVAPASGSETAVVPASREVMIAARSISAAEAEGRAQGQPKRCPAADHDRACCGRRRRRARRRAGHRRRARWWPA